MAPPPCSGEDRPDGEDGPHDCRDPSERSRCASRHAPRADAHHYEEISRQVRQGARPEDRDQAASSLVPVVALGVQHRSVSERDDRGRSSQHVVGQRRLACGELALADRLGKGNLRFRYLSAPEDLVRPLRGAAPAAPRRQPVGPFGFVTDKEPTRRSASERRQRSPESDLTSGVKRA